MGFLLLDADCGRNDPPEEQRWAARPSPIIRQVFDAFANGAQLLSQFRCGQPIEIIQVACKLGAGELVEMPLQNGYFCRGPGGGRPLSEFFRAPAEREPFIGTLTASQAVCLSASLICLIALLIYNARTSKPSPEVEDSDIGQDTP